MRHWSARAVGAHQPFAHGLTGCRASVVLSPTHTPRSDACGPRSSFRPPTRLGATRAPAARQRQRQRERQGAGSGSGSGGRNDDQRPSQRIPCGIPDTTNVFETDARGASREAPSARSAWAAGRCRARGGQSGSRVLRPIATGTGSSRSGNPGGLAARLGSLRQRTGSLHGSCFPGQRKPGQRPSEPLRSTLDALGPPHVAPLSVLCPGLRATEPELDCPARRGPLSCSTKRDSSRLGIERGATCGSWSRAS